MANFVYKKTTQTSMKVAGIIDTDMNKGYSEEDLESIKNEIPLGKIGTTGSVARCVKWLLEDDYTTGEVISINGGWYI